MFLILDALISFCRDAYKHLNIVTWNQCRLSVQWNVQLKQSTGLRSGSEDNHVNSLHSVYEQRGKYSTSSEFKTQVMQKKKIRATNVLLTQNSLKSQSSPWSSACFFFFFFSSEQTHILPGDAGKWEQYYPEHTQLLDSLGDYCSSIFYDKSHSLDNIIYSTNSPLSEGKYETGIVR